MANNKIPNHVGFIPDGNRRWAVDHGLSKESGYAHVCWLLTHPSAFREIFTEITPAHAPFLFTGLPLKVCPEKTRHPQAANYNLISFPGHRFTEAANTGPWHG